MEKKDLSVTQMHTISASGSSAGTMTLTSLAFAVVIEDSRESLLKYNWQPDVLSMEMVGAAPCDHPRRE